MLTMLMTHAIVGALGFAMGWAMLSRKQKSSNEQLDEKYLCNFAALKNELTRSTYISSN